MTTESHQAPLGDMPATRRSVNVSWMAISHFQGDRLVSDYEIFGLGMQQVGAIPTTEPQPAGVA